VLGELATQIQRSLDDRFSTIIHVTSDDDVVQGLVRWINALVTCARGVFAEVERTTLELTEAMLNTGERELQLRAILDASPEAILTVDGDGIVRSWNQAGERIFGFPAEEIVGRSLRRLLPDMSDAELGAILQKGLGRPDGVGPIERSAWCRDGLFVPVDIRLRGMETSGGRLLVAIIRDISTEKDAEEKLAATHSQLLDVSRRAGMAEVATSVLHNVGNTLNTVNVSATVLREAVERSRVGDGLSRVAQLLQAGPAALTQGDQGPRLCAYLIKLAEAAGQERTRLIEEIGLILQGVEHMKSVISLQQERAKLGGVREEIAVAALIDQALRFESASLSHNQITVERRYGELPPCFIEKHKLLEILMNLISNARQALCAVSLAQRPRRLTVSLEEGAPGRVRIVVTDNGIGIPPEQAERIFTYGFTTKKDGHGFGLHASALAAQELGGSLTCHSDGADRGATFTVEFPLRAQPIDG
jgi:PAS domain S-box-containing protein